MNRVRLIRNFQNKFIKTNLRNRIPSRTFSLLELSQNVSESEGNRFLIHQFMKNVNQSTQNDSGKIDFRNIIIFLIYILNKLFNTSSFLI